MSRLTKLYEQLRQLERDIDDELERNGKSETYWEWLDRLDKLSDKIVDLEEAEYGEYE